MNDSPHSKRPDRPEHDLHNRIRHRRQLKRAARGISDTDALNAYFAFSTDIVEDTEIELVLGRLLVLLDRHDLLLEEA